MHEITQEQALNRFRAKKTYGVTLKDIAGEFGVSTAFVSAVMSGEKPMTEPMLKAVGVTKRTVFEATE